MKKRKHLAVRVPEDLRAKVLKYAEEHKWSISSAICIILTTYLEKYELSGDL